MQGFIRYAHIFIVQGMKIVSKDLYDFLADTSIYVQETDLPDTPSPMETIDKELKVIASEILALDEESILFMQVYPASCQLKLGRLGTYVLNRDVNTLLRVSYRLQQISNSPRLIKAILGQWPA